MATLIRPLISCSPVNTLNGARPKMVLAISLDFQYLAIPSRDRTRFLTSNHLQMAEGRNYDRIVVKRGSRERPLPGPDTKVRARALTGYKSRGYIGSKAPARGCRIAPEMSCVLQILRARNVSEMKIMRRRAIINKSPANGGKGAGRSGGGLA